MKPNQSFTPYNILTVKYLYSLQTFPHVSPPSYFPFPTESRPSKSAQLVLSAFFCFPAKRRKLAFVSEDGEQKNRDLRQQRPLLLWSMMARGGRENGAKRRNPNLTLNTILDSQDGVFAKSVWQRLQFVRPFTISGQELVRGTNCPPNETIQPFLH